MPSYKKKYEFLRTHIEIMERKVLLDEYILTELRDRIDELSVERDTIKEKERISDYQKNQLYLALNEIEELVTNQKATPPDLANRSTSEVIEITVDTLHRISKSLRDSNVRANTILENIAEFPRGKLLKRERKEQIIRSRNASMSSLAGRLSPSSSRNHLASPPGIPGRDRSNSNSTRDTSTRN
ncbi:MAG: hypothetical protein [Trichoderma harzianum negative-stranded virus 2]|nr:MAG: hypothetical protein [Trichoderma harzianum negative-stranded virus 2]